MEYKLQRFDMTVPGSPQYNNRTELYTVSDDEIVGHLSLDFLDGYTAITWVYVNPHFRDKGIASTLLEEAWNITMGYKIDTLGLVVDKSPVQSDLIKYYQNRGFVLSGGTTKKGGINMHRDKQGEFK